ncbi:MAG TPA: methylenetetrahydrofolate reductase [NAD(P)H] [Spirochaetota bacterium]|nr:methylenetetrahydrofolate reductase [NAD(P)H] [Spirochaetota bacterium]HOL56779.1 methylenetetrahydrofolate reductase [NAD(P)H] [Spirochaetota bacterium]HPP04246.1 methylenetetrahydrofolate reductase [NAD(P)H] [Spirochaetota bacterium]
MFIKDMFKKDKTVISVEVFPPKRDDDVEKLYQTIEELKVIKPDFVSVTYGAGGSTRDKTVDIASKIKNKIGIEVMAHLTCVNSTKEEIGNVITQLKNNNIQNILALRGDPPQGQTNFTKTIGGFGHANELVAYIRSRNEEWSIGVAGYPEGHIESPSLEEDIKNLKRKVDSGADFIVSQLYYDNNDFFKFLDLTRKAGINVPIIPGIFPILNFNTIKKITSLCGAKIPKNLLEKLEKYQDNSEETEKIGIEYAINQTLELIENKIEGIHFYSMNKSKATITIYNSIKDKIKRI